jgi:hypothetical protein
MRVSRSGYYDWLKRPAKVVRAETLNLYRRVKWLIKQSRQSLGSKEMTTGLVSKALVKADNLRQPVKGLVFHSD